MWNWDLFFRYLLEYAMMFPGILFCFIPTADNLRHRPARCFALTSILIAGLIFTGAAVSALFRLSSNYLIFPFLVLLFFVFRFLCTLSCTKLLFVFFNSTALISWCTLETVFLFSPLEITDSAGPFMIASGVFNLVLSFGIGVLYYRFLSVYLPQLFDVPVLERLWKWFFLLPMAVTIILIWCTPLDPANVLVGRIRLIGMVMFGLLIFVLLGFYLFFWYISGRLGQEEKLRRENMLLTAEEDRYLQLQENILETRRVRHDFRQHLRVMHEFVTSGQFDRLREYLDEYEGTLLPQHETFSSNPAVDAIASYYDNAAKSQQTRIMWKIRLPEQMPLSDNEYCVILGNLLENALHAVAKLPDRNRFIRVNAQIIGSSMLGTSVSNPYTGSISFGKDGFPVIKGHHGIGLTSVAHEVRQNGGTIAIESENNTFTVNIVFNL